MSRPRPPEAVAEGQSLQGIGFRPSSATEIDVRSHRHNCDVALAAPTCTLGATRITKKRRISNRWFLMNFALVANGVKQTSDVGHNR